MNTAAALAFRLALLLAPQAVLGAPTVITLRPAAQLHCPPRAGDPCPLPLSAIADITGADHLAGLTIAPDARATPTVDLAELRALLDRAGVNWGDTTLNGARCTITVLDHPTTTPPQATDHAPPAPTVPPPAAHTLRAAILRQLAAHYAVDPHDLRAQLRDLPPARPSTPGAGPAPITLDTPLSDHRVQVDPLGGPGSARLPIALTLYQHDRILFTRRAVADILIHTTVTTARRPLERGHALTRDDLQLERRWLPPGPTPRSAAPDALVGAAAAARIPAGAVLDERSVEAPLLVKRGEPVSVHCLSGAVGLRLKARALESGRAGETIKLQADASTAVFTARIDGPGRAVVLVEPARPTGAHGSTE